MRGRPRVARTAPEGVAGLEREQRLRHVRLGEDDGTRRAQRLDNLFGPEKVRTDCEMGGDRA